MPPVDIIAAALLNGLLTGGVYALVALGLTLIYGVLHIVNFAHGSLLMLAMYGAWLLVDRVGLDPYAALPLLTGIAFLAGWALYAGVIGRISHGDDRAILLATLGVAVVLDNLALVVFTGDSRTIDTPYAFAVVPAGPSFTSVNFYNGADFQRGSISPCGIAALLASALGGGAGLFAVGTISSSVDRIVHSLDPLQSDNAAVLQGLSTAEGGISAYEPQPSYQSGVVTQSTSARSGGAR